MVHNLHTQPIHQALKEAAPKQTASTSSVWRTKGCSKTPEPETAAPMPVQKAKQAKGAFDCLVQGCLELPRALLHWPVPRV